MKINYKKIKILLIAILFTVLVISPLSFVNSTITKGSINLTQNEKSTFDLPTNLSIQYVIITTESLKKSSFQQLIEHKSQYMNATIVTKEEIINNPIFWVNGKYGDATSESYGNPWIRDNEEAKYNLSTFNDTSAKIRNFIRFACHEWGTKYVLLGGDVELIPTRKFYVEIPQWYSGFLLYFKIWANIVSDLYYAGLNGSWNNDCDKRFGEERQFSIDEEADFIADVYVGRAPVGSQYEADTFVQKVISFETSEKPKDVLLHQSYPQPSKTPDTTIIPEACSMWIPNDFTVHKLYESFGMVTADDWVQCFRDPSKLLILHIGNGYYDTLTNWYQLSWDNHKRIKFSNMDVGRLENTFYPIHISISCLSGNFSENECLGEELLLWSRGGPSACIFNSEVGCISQHNAIAYSGEFIEREFYEIFENKTEHLGEALQRAKEFFIIQAGENSAYRWCYYEINLLGDPEMPINTVRNILPPVEVFVDDNHSVFTPGWNNTKFNSIKKAIDAVTPNGKIHVSNGIYYETIEVNKTVEIIGEDKFNTIICGEGENTIVTLRTNSSKLCNFTITHSCPDTKEKNGAGVFIPQGSEGNEIKNCIIRGNNQYGVLIQSTCRNFVFDNVIESNGIGVAIINNRNGLFETSFIITCDNMISNNTIRENDNYGVYLESSIHNRIIENTFLNNGKQGSGLICSDAFFYLSKYTVWKRNYWGEPLSEPKKIFGIRGPIFIGIPDFSNGWMFPEWIYIAIINLGYPYFDYDANPAQEP